jgi:hypothetical protein
MLLRAEALNREGMGKGGGGKGMDIAMSIEHPSYEYMSI